MSGLIQNLRRVLGMHVKEFVGSDRLGNKYYVISIRGRDTVKRIVEPPELKFGDAGDIDNVPPEWRSWLVGRRDSTPTEEEQEEIRMYKDSVAQNVINLKREEKNRQKDIDNKVLPNVGVDHASAKLRGPNKRFAEDEAQPESIGDTFHPGKWQP